VLRNNAENTILVDMDDVLADFSIAVLNRIQSDYPHITTVLDRPNFYIEDDYDKEHRATITAISEEPGFFASLPLIDNALTGWQRIVDLGYSPQICSSPLSRNPTCTTEKLEWLEKHFVPHFGKLVVESAIIVKDKYLVDGVALIDDRPDIENSMSATWQHIIFDRTYNRQTSHDLRLYDWLDPKLPELLATAHDLYRKKPS
jgi:5'-nucleotidase